MGKLNYTNRKCEGEKLGEVVAKDLAKRIPPSIGSKSALRDPVVELDVSGKALTNIGFSKVYDGLVKSMLHDGDQGRVVRLEELCLRDSQLDTLSLPSIAHIVALAANDIRDLDLSENRFTIVNEEDAKAWEGFLISLADCCVLRRIDLSSNKLGSRAFEILTRVYAKENPIDLESLFKITTQKINPVDNELETRTRKMNIHTNNNNNGDCLDIESPVTVGKIDSTQHEPDSSEIPAIFKSTRGLRSVPYLIFSDTSMTEICALHLSYVIAYHGLPKQLLRHVPAAKAGLPAQQLHTYDQIPDCRGIIYSANPGLGPAGMKVLDLAESVREGQLVEDDDEVDEEVPETGSLQFKSEVNLRRGSEPRGNLITTANRHRTNTLATAADHGGNVCKSNAKIELDRARSRIQGNTLHEAGAGSNDLWRAALKMLTLGRNIRPLIKKGPTPNKASRFQDDKSAGSTFRSLKSPSLRSTPLAPRNPNQPVNVNFSQWRLENSKLVPVLAPESLPKKPSQPADPPRAESQELPYKTQLPCGFSEDVWRKIIAFATGAQAVMTETQQRSMLKWAMNRETLVKEKESLGLKESAQIWKVLEATGCLAYEINV